MACLIDAWRHVHLPPLHCIREIKKKIRPSSYQNSLLQGMNNIDFLFMGDTHIRHNIVFFRSVPAAALLLVFLRLSPSFHRTALCSSGGRGACAATSVLAVGLALLLQRGVLAGRQGHSVSWSEISIVRYHYKMYNTRGFSCKDTFSFSLRSPSLSISSSSLDPCILY